MGTIIGSKIRDDGKIIFEICVESKEAQQLKGQVDDVCLIPCHGEQEETRIVQRGKNEATMYFLVPKAVRAELTTQKKALFQKVDTPRKTLYIYTVKNG